MAVRSISKGNKRRQGSNVLLLVGTVVLVVLLSVCLVILLGVRQEKISEITPVYVAEYDTVDVPVPVDVVPTGTKVSDIQVKYVSYPRHQLPVGALLSLASVQNAVTTTMLPANLPFFRENLKVGGSGRNPVIEQIPQGMRAITVRVDATAAVEGWATSGSVVDVLLVEQARTSVIAEQVKILSTERIARPPEGSVMPQIPSTVTLLVTQQQALALTTAVTRGRIAFALRSKQDEEGWFDKDFTAEKLYRKELRSSKQQEIKGFVAVKTENGEKKFALTEKGWIPSDVRPKQLFPEIEFENEER